MLVTRGFKELPDFWYDEAVPGVELELAEQDEATIGKCLFDDFEG